jgi:curli production assembly/transport component CsgF
MEMIEPVQVFIKIYSTMKHLIVSLILIASCATTGLAQDFKYKAKNPAFGGDTFNYNWLLSQAQAQNDFSEDPNSDPFARDPLETFQSDLNRQILRQLTNSLTQDLFGEDGSLNEGSFEVGDFQIEIINGTGGVNIGIFNTLTNSQTTITIPSL